MFTPSKTAWQIDGVGSAADTTPRKRKEAHPVPSGFRLPAMLAAALLASVSTAARAANPVQVPAIQTAAATPQAASVDSGTPPAPRPATRTASVEPTKAWPPPLQVLAPSAPLGPKAREAVRLVHRWRARRVFPHPGPDGVVRWLYGATEPTVVCAPLMACTIELQPGETPRKIDIGDQTEWNTSVGSSGGNDGRWEVTVKPWDAGERTDLNILTNRRTYTIELLSVRSQIGATPLTAFSYPLDPNQQLSAAQDMYYGDPPGAPAAAGPI
ncbi:MAG TPA: TrbG/VirB9 family P-type conjugative transfer protein, partial [Stellaceae bacterium]|nr:TrbG/VirB9 family P-type conjugative transfer protein [Stellaceae bacterium]